MTDDILGERRGAAGIITLNRPERHNAIGYEMWRAIAARVRELGADPQVRVIVIRGAGERAFAAGGDIAEFPARRGDHAATATYHAAVEDALGAIAAAEQPTIAMIHGYCIGGGCELASACDLRLADDRARLGVTATKIGLVLGVAELRQLLALVGPATAKELLFTGRLLDAQEALRVGLVNAVVPAADLEATTLELAGRIAANAPIAVAAAKALLAGLARGDGADDLAALHEAFSRRAAASADYAEGVRTFLEKRPPRFTGR